MPETLKNPSRNLANAFIDYRPAEMRIGTDWLIVYYAKNPATHEMKRFRLAVPKCGTVYQRKQHGIKIVTEINRKLASGWLPFYDDLGVLEFKTLDFCIKQFIDHTKSEVEKQIKRVDTLRSYTSFLSMIIKYIAERKIKMNFVLDFNRSFVVNYLDWIYYDRQNSARTYNNHLAFIGSFVNHCIDRGYLKNNFTTGILKKTNQAKTRQVFTSEIKNKIKELQNEKFNYFTLCMATYFCFIRRTELTKLKVSAVNLINNIITIDATESKNKKTEIVTIPEPFANLLIVHLKEANNKDYLFSDNDFKPGLKPLNPKKISDVWDVVRTKKSIDVKYQFYSFKDTGITDLLLSGIAAIKVRDQARHYDIKITESYTPRNIKCDDSVRKSNVNF